MGVGGPAFNIFKDFFSNCVLVDRNFNQFKPVVSDIPQGSVLDPLLFIFYTANIWNDLENKIISYTDNTTLYAEVAYPSDCINAAYSLNSGLA